MVRTRRDRSTAVPGAVVCLPVTSAEAEGAAVARWRVRFVTGFRPPRWLLAGGLLVVGWLLGIVFAILGSSPAAAETLAVAETHTAGSVAVAGSVFSSVSPGEDALAMAGSRVNGLTSQSSPESPAPAVADRHHGTIGFVPQSGGGAPPSPSGEAVWYDHAPRAGTALRLPAATVPHPVGRTAADDPSFSPD